MLFSTRHAIHDHRRAFILRAMGCAGSTENKRSKEIDAEIEGDKERIQNEIKLLLLGAGESGKTTFQKQIKMLYLKGFTEEEQKTFKGPVYNNLVVCIRSLVKAAEDFGYELNDEVFFYFISPSNILI